MPGVNAMSCQFMWRNVIIDEADLIPLIKAKAGCGHFQINLKDKPVPIPTTFTNPTIKLEATPSKVPPTDVIVLDEGSTTDSLQEEACHSPQTIITSAKFTDYVNANQNTKRLLHSDHTEPSVRKGIINCACDFLAQECGQNANLFFRNEMVKVVVDVFNGLELQEQFVTKWLDLKLKNDRRAKQAKLEVENQNQASKKRKIEYENQIDYLKSCGMPVDFGKMKTALKTTLNTRLMEYAREDFSVFDTYKFFTKSTDLVRFY